MVIPVPVPVQVPAPSIAALTPVPAPDLPHSDLIGPRDLVMPSAPTLFPSHSPVSSSAVYAIPAPMWDAPPPSYQEAMKGDELQNK